MKKIVIISVLSALLAACGSGTSQTQTGDGASGSAKPTGNPSYDPNRGTGKFTQVDISSNLDEAKAEAGKHVFDVKCNACHKLTSEKLVGPGWKDVTKRHEAVWIMNFVTNTDEMINKDPKVQAMLEICLVRMPNQNVSDSDARNVYEFMRQNDGVK